MAPGAELFDSIRDHTRSVAYRVDFVSILVGSCLVAALLWIRVGPNV